MGCRGGSSVFVSWPGYMYWLVGMYYLAREERACVPARPWRLSTSGFTVRVHEATAPCMKRFRMYVRRCLSVRPCPLTVNTYLLTCCTGISVVAWCLAVCVTVSVRNGNGLPSLRCNSVGRSPSPRPARCRLPKKAKQSRRTACATLDGPMRRRRPPRPRRASSITRCGPRSAAEGTGESVSTLFALG